MTKDQLIQEIQAVVDRFRIQGNETAARKWESCIAAVNGEAGGISLDAAEAWLKRSRARGWASGKRLLPLVIELLGGAKPAAEEEDEDGRVDELRKIRSSYDEMDERTLKGYLGVARGGNMPLALSRLEEELAEREADKPPRPGPNEPGHPRYPGDPKDVAWKDADTFGKGKAGKNVKFVSGGGYRDYVLALEQDKDRMGNRGKAIAGNVQNQLAGEIDYLDGRVTRGTDYGGEATGREIQRRYGLPCWGALNARAHEAFYRTLQTIGTESTKAAWAAFRKAHDLTGSDHDDDWWEHPDWKAWSEAQPYMAVRRLLNEHNGLISGGRDFFNRWMGGLRDEFLAAAPEEYHAHINALEAYLPLRYYMENGIEPPAAPERKRTVQDVEEDMADAQAAGDWTKLRALIAEREGMA